MVCVLDYCRCRGIIRAGGRQQGVKRRRLEGGAAAVAAAAGAAGGSEDDDEENEDDDAGGYCRNMLACMVSCHAAWGLVHASNLGPDQ